MVSNKLRYLGVRTTYLITKEEEEDVESLKGMENKYLDASKKLTHDGKMHEHYNKTSGISETNRYKALGIIKK